jgi:6-phosphogluconolactonase
MGTDGPVRVDERIAPAADPDRNLTHLRDHLGEAPAEVIAMPVNDPDQADAAARYSALLPERFDLVHPGLGPDGHTASLVAGDPVLDMTDHLVAITGTYQGRQRMTLTYRSRPRHRPSRLPRATGLASSQAVPARAWQATVTVVVCSGIFCVLLGSGAGADFGTGLFASPFVAVMSYAQHDGAGALSSAG